MFRCSKHISTPITGSMRFFFTTLLLNIAGLGCLVNCVAIPRALLTLSALDYEAIIVGGGPAGLAALSGLARVRRKALLIDSGEYRNGPTRHMHDVLGYDGVTPAYFRHRARQQISHYSTVSFTNGTVTRITPSPNPHNPEVSFFTVTVTPTTSDMHHARKELTARKIILATGLTDVLPSTPGLAENWGRGIYWCPWCDGHEHADQPMGLLGSLRSVVESFREIITLNSDVIAFVNGTDTPRFRAMNDRDFPGWEEYLALHNVRIDNRTIAAITRLKDGSGSEGDHDTSPVPSKAEFDLFNVEFTNENQEDKNVYEVEERAVFFTSFPSRQRSRLGEETGVYMYSPGRLGVDQNMQTNIEGIYAVGDANSDNSTNVLHAMYSGKRAAVFLHQKLSREDSEWEVKNLAPAARPKFVDRETTDFDARSTWAVMNGESREDDILYAGEFEEF